MSKKTTGKIPRFGSSQEEAEFWDTHDSAEFEDEFRKVELKYEQPLIHVLELELSAEMVAGLIAIARKQRVSLNELAVAWLKERLAANGPAPASSGGGNLDVSKEADR